MVIFAKSPARRFALFFALLSGTLLALYYFPYGQDGGVKQFLDGYLRGYAAVAGAVLGWFEPSITVHGQDIIGRYSLRIVKTCDAMDVQILFVSAVLAWSGRWRRRLLGAATGVVVLFWVNVARICSLYYVGIMRPSSFEFVHLELWPAVIVILSVAGFLVFTAWTSAGAGTSRAPA
jgi:exosortase/archaeosortase family protein